MTSPDDFFGGGATLSYDVNKYPREQIFRVWRGGKIIESPQIVQARDFDTGQPKFYDDGNPVKQMKVVLQTNIRESEMDDGVRVTYISGQKKTAVSQALREASAKSGQQIKGLKQGGTYYEMWESEEPNKRGRGYPTKIYKAAYQPPTPQEEAFFAEQASAPGMGTQIAQHAAQAVQPDPLAVSPQQAAAMNQFNMHQAAAQVNASQPQQAPAAPPAYQQAPAAAPAAPPAAPPAQPPAYQQAPAAPPAGNPFSEQAPPDPWGQQPAPPAAPPAAPAPAAPPAMPGNPFA